MRKYFAISLALIALASLARPQEPPQPRHLPGPYEFYGPIHTFREKCVSFTLVNGKPVEGTRCLTLDATFNEDGTKQEKTLYFNGQIMNRSEQSYDPDGRLLETRDFRTDQGLDKRTVNVYDDQKQLIEQITYRPDNSVLQRRTIRRDGQESQIETTAFDSQGRISSQISAHKDLKTGRADYISITPGETIQDHEYTMRNPDGSQEYRSENSNGFSYRYVIVDDGPGRSDRIVYNQDGTIKERVRTLREFDSYHNQIKETELTAMGDSAEFRLTKITSRSITYYPKD